jgi:hypothetical protein
MRGRGLYGMAIYELQNSEDIQDELKLEYEENIKLYGYPSYSYKINCHTCGKVFYCRRPEGKYCSYRCRNDGYIARRKIRNLKKRQKVCTVCGVSFTAKRKDTLYCSPKCKQREYRNRKLVTGNSCGNVAVTGRGNEG